MQSSSVNLNIELEKFIVERHVDSATAEYFREFFILLSESLPQLISELSPSANALKGVLVLIDEISKREKVSEKEVFISCCLSEVLADENIPRKEKIKRVRDRLEKRRYPERSRLENMIEENVSAIRKNYNLKISMPEELEGDSIELKISGRNAEDFKLAAERISKLSESGELSTLFGVLRGEL